jgi:deoxyadenosine/deoxycytidine kinase
MIISIEGNIGAGKSTLLRRLRHMYETRGEPYMLFSALMQLSIQFPILLFSMMIIPPEINVIFNIAVAILLYKTLFKRRRVVFLEEPIDEWNKIAAAGSGRNIFECYCAEQKKYAFVFQMLCLQTRAEMLRRAIRENPRNTVIVCERSIKTDAEIFAQMLHDTHKMNEIEYKVYMKWYKTIITEIPEIKTIYLYTEPTDANERKKKRDRAGEENIDMEYMNLLHKYNENVFGGGRATLQVEMVDMGVMYDYLAANIMEIIEYGSL